MTEASSSALTLSLPSDREIVLARVFDVPRALVFEAHTTCEHLKHWWGPRKYEVTACENDLRPGGAWRMVHRDAEGNEFAFRGEYREIVPPQRIVRTFEFEGMPGHVSLETLVLTEQGGKTTLTNTVLFDSKEDRDGMVASGMKDGASESMDRLDEYLRTMAGPAWAREFVISRTFDAPRELVWKAWTEPERLAQWWGPKGFAMLSCKLDLRPGGVFHYGMRSPEYGDMWGKFVYREIKAPERLVFIVSFSDENGGITRHPMSATWPLEVLTTLTLTEHEDKTIVTLKGGPINATAGEHKAFGAGYESMEQGFAGTFDQLDAYLAKA